MFILCFLIVMSVVGSFFKVVGVVVLFVLFFAFVYVVSCTSWFRSWYRGFISDVASFSPTLASFVRVVCHYLFLFSYYCYLVVKLVIEFFSSLIYNARPVSV